MYILKEISKHDKRNEIFLLYKFVANPDRVAVPLSGPGGKIAVLELKKTGRLPDGVMPALVHGATVMDFQWDPFDNQRLAVGKVLKIIIKKILFCILNLKEIKIINFACVSL